MTRSKVMFFAFTGEALNQLEKILHVESGYECWDLKKFTLDQFVEELKRKIPPVNDNVLRNYKSTEGTIEPYGLTEKQFKNSSWGLLIPDTLEEGGFSYHETLLLLNLYSPHFLYPEFYVNDMGITKQKHNKDPMIYSHNHDGAIFQRKKFVTFYKLLFEQAKYATWSFDYMQTWNKEDWRLFVAALLYSGLKDYENEKSPFGWQRESAEMATILEALFTAGDAHNEEVIYRLKKRVAVLLSWKFPDVEEDIKKLYKARSAFVHGSFFEQIAKESIKSDNIPIPDFELLYKHKEYVRLALVSYLNWARVIRSGAVDGLTSAMGSLEHAIMDIELRKKITLETEKLFTLMPEPLLGLI